MSPWFVTTRGAPVKLVYANQPQWRLGVDAPACWATTTSFAMSAGAAAAASVATTKQHPSDMDRIGRPTAQGGFSTG